MKEYVQYSIDLLRRSERLALRMNPKGFWLAFSGGKDSQCLYHLAKMAGVKFEAHYSLTTLDPPELVRFIRDKYPDVVIDRPALTFLQLCKKKKILPTRIMRFCCAELKESAGIGYVTLIGVRHSESARRARRGEMEVSDYKFNGSFDEFEIYDETTHGCYNGRDKLMLAPIIKWDDRMVWSFLKDNNIEYCKLYDEGWSRLGCLFCPMSSIKNIRRDERRYPRYKAALVRTISWLLTNTDFCNTLVERYNATAEEIYEAWVSKKPYDTYLANLRYQKRLEL